MKRMILFTTAWMICAATLFAQGVQTGTVRGIVRDQQALSVPGVKVTATSPALQGARVATTDELGAYTLPVLPAGDYQLKFELDGFEPSGWSLTVPLGLTLERNVTLAARGVAVAVNVVAPGGVAVGTPVVGANFVHKTIQALAVPRTIVGIAALSPGVSEAAPNPNALVINGAFSFDNAFLINGVDVNDNLFATPQNLFVEDAIAETQVLTSGISAEYGRFGGGVINAITKSGGNTFAGSARIGFSNPSWITATPFEVAKGSDQTAHPNSLQTVYEGTFGGPVVTDRLWFFTSGRYQSVDAPVTLQQTGITLSSVDENKRAEIKLTGTFAPNQTLQGGFFNDPRKRTNNSGIQALVIDPHSEVNRENPNWYVFANYHGVAKRHLLAEAQYSERRYSFLNDGGTSQTSGPNATPADLRLNSPFVGTCFCTFYNAPAFDSTDPEERNNRQVTGSLSGFWRLGGRHETKGGYEFFRSQHTGGNSQSPTQYAFAVDFLTGPNGPVLDATGRPIPVFKPGQSMIAYFPAIKGAVLNNDSNSVYVQDHWMINGRWSADLGARFERVRMVSTGNVVSVDASRIVPRLAAAYDVNGRGTQTLHFTYGQYSGRYNDVALGKNSPVGNPPEIDLVYRGPAGQGYDFAPAFNLANYPLNSDNAVYVADPTQNVKVDPNLKSPLTHEFTASYGASFWDGRGSGEVAYIARRTHDLIEDFQTKDGGTTDVIVNGLSAGLFTNIVYRNTDLARRRYQGLVFQSRYRLSNRWSVNGHYTLQLQNDGNYEGEGSNRPGVTSFIGNYPEAFTATRNFPDGRLQSFQRSRLRVWSVYDWSSARYGDLSLSGLLRLDSAQVYSLVATNQGLTATQQAILKAAGYVDGPGPGNNVFFDGRGSQSFSGFGVFDTSINYNIPVFRSLRPWVKVDVFNVFNNQKLIAWNTKISADPGSTTDGLGIPTGYTAGTGFGTATGNTVTNYNSSTINAFPVAYNGAQPGGRTLLVAVGVRF